MAYADYHDMLQMTEDLISGELSSALLLSLCYKLHFAGMVKEILGTYKIERHLVGKNTNKVS